MSRSPLLVISDEVLFVDDEGGHMLDFEWTENFSCK